MRKAVVLLSGGLDSATTLYYALSKGYSCSCLIFDYKQRHKKEVNIAINIATKAKCEYFKVDISLPWKGSALLDHDISLPSNNIINNKEIPVTYVPARNIIFLSFGASFAESINAKTIFIGANAIDYSGYPDCRPSFLKSFEDMIKEGLKTGVENNPIKIKAPLIKKTKSQIIKMALDLNAPLQLTWSCYAGGKKPCMKCDSCKLRSEGFSKLGLTDPAIGEGRYE